MALNATLSDLANEQNGYVLIVGPDTHASEFTLQQVLNEAPNVRFIYLYGALTELHQSLLQSSSRTSISAINESRDLTSHRRHHFLVYGFPAISTDTKVANWLRKNSASTTVILLGADHRITNWGWANRLVTSLRTRVDLGTQPETSQIEFVNRVQEKALLAGKFEQDEGSCIVISGVEGIGKRRLVKHVAAECGAILISHECLSGDAAAYSASQILQQLNGGGGEVAAWRRNLGAHLQSERRRIVFCLNHADRWLSRANLDWEDQSHGDLIRTLQSNGMAHVVLVLDSHIPDFIASIATAQLELTPLSSRYARLLLEHILKYRGSHSAISTEEWTRIEATLPGHPGILSILSELGARVEMWEDLNKGGKSSIGAAVWNYLESFSSLKAGDLELLAHGSLFQMPFSLREMNVLDPGATARQLERLTRRFLLEHHPGEQELFAVPGWLTRSLPEPSAAARAHSQLADYYAGRARSASLMEAESERSGRLALLHRMKSGQDPAETFDVAPRAILALQARSAFRSGQLHEAFRVSRFLRNARRSPSLSETLLYLLSASECLPPDQADSEYQVFISEAECRGDQTAEHYLRGSYAYFLIRQGRFQPAKRQVSMMEKGAITNAQKASLGILSAFCQGESEPTVARQSLRSLLRSISSGETRDKVLVSIKLAEYYLTRWWEPVWALSLSEHETTEASMSPGYTRRLQALISEGVTLLRSGVLTRSHAALLSRLMRLDGAIKNAWEVESKLTSLPHLRGNKSEVETFYFPPVTYMQEDGTLLGSRVSSCRIGHDNWFTAARAAKKALADAETCLTTALSTAPVCETLLMELFCVRAHTWEVEMVERYARDRSTLSTPPRVFLSYSHDSEAHRHWVRELAEDLQRDMGVAVTLDQWHLKEGEELTLFMEQAAQCEFVVMVCTPQYAAKVNQRQGGAGYEGSLLTSQVLDGLQASQLIPVMRGDPQSSRPLFLGSRKWVDFREPTKYRNSLEQLARAIHGKPKNLPPPVGSSPF